ncbi:unnamed protein product [Rotaria magnacalcarata]|uniref:Ubiquitin carboxyl-terminal hydrolase 36 n=1 Tax=Rotaria magnacalcarata TaxID=392030 RepID=A0A816XM96_9BILA|nr:unnamed protein product [Rotaria magnacalcarata]
MEWSITHKHGLGLSNTNKQKQCLNICYINSIIQCLANIAPFVQWLLNKENHMTCTLTKNDEFCSCCVLHSFIGSIHRNIRNLSDPFAQLSQASAISMTRYITQLSSSFIPGHQEDPSEFLVVLFDHLIQCLSSTRSSDTANLSSAIHIIFGIILESSIKCTQCLNENSKQSYESIWSISIISYLTLEQALDGFCSVEELTGDDKFYCSNCQAKRFIHDKDVKVIRKIKQFISYPEVLDISPFLTSEIIQLNHEQSTSNVYIYKLNAVVVHIGEAADSGHIFSYIRSPDNLWYKADDTSVQRIDLDTVLACNNSYILCYAKSSTAGQVLRETEFFKSYEESSRVLFSSTPVRRDGITCKIIDHQTSSPLNICIFDEESPDRFTRIDSATSNKCTSDKRENISSIHVSFQEDPLPLNSDLFSIHNQESIELHTESRIEFIPKVNRHLRDSDKLIIPGSSLVSAVLSQICDNLGSTQKHVLSSNDSTQSSIRSTQRKEYSNLTDGLQLHSIGEDFEDDGNFRIDQPSSFMLKLKSVDLIKLKTTRTKKINKKTARLFEATGLPVDIGDKCKKNIIVEKTETNTYSKQRDHEHIKYCNFGIKTGDHNIVLRCNIYCIGRPVCSFSGSLIFAKTGSCHLIVNNTTITHTRGVKICRPMRDPIRSLLKKQFAQGAAVYRIYQDQLKKRSIEEKKAFNYDTTGKNRSILTKIKSEQALESLLSSNVDESIVKLCEKYQEDINPDGKVPGAIQQICKWPCQIIVFTESSIRLFDMLLNYKNVVLSWDATGSIIQEKKDSARLLYYELSITLPGIVSENSIVPVTFMISDAHSLVNILHWLQLFKYNHSLVFPGKPFPRPRIVLSDRAQIFLIVALQLWNNESMKDFLHRAYRIVNDNADDTDLQTTNIHACLAHVLLDVRKTINKFIDERYRELAMWSIALLINTSSWFEFKHNWKLICLVLLKLHFGEDDHDREAQDALLEKINNIKSDANTVDAIKCIQVIQEEDTAKATGAYLYDFDDGADDDNDEIVIDEELEANATNSPFKSAIQKIFQDALDVIGISIEEAQGVPLQSILKWFKYLTNFFMPTLPIWSNLLLGDLTRHHRRIVQSFERVLITLPEQRTTAISERLMGILKRTQLGGHIHIRLDMVLSILVPDMITIIDEFSNSLCNHVGKSINHSNDSYSMILDEQRLKPIEERWRQSCNKRGHGHYTKCPAEPVFTDLVSSLLACRRNVSAGLKLPSLSPDWLSIAIGLILSIENNHHHRRRRISPSSSLSSSNVSPLIDVIYTFIEEWLNDKGKKSLN